MTGRDTGAVASSAQVKGIIAGGGTLPTEIAEEIRAKGDDVFVIAIEDEAGENIAPYDHVFIKWSQATSIFERFEAKGVREVVFAGSITHRPELTSLVNWSVLKTLPGVLAMMLGGDNTILSTCIQLFEKRGFKLMGAHEIAPGLLTTQGAIVGKAPKKHILDNMNYALEAVRLLGGLDVGQAAVADGGRVVAIEGVEGTDLLLERVCEMRKIGRLSNKPGNGVLVKAAKPGQDLRADLPSIGPRTIELVKQAELAGLVLEAGASLILSREETQALAKKEGVFIYGVPRIDHSNIDHSGIDYSGQNGQGS